MRGPDHKMRTNRDTRKSHLSGLYAHVALVIILFAPERLKLAFQMLREGDKLAAILGARTEDFQDALVCAFQLFRGHETILPLSSGGGRIVSERTEKAYSTRYPWASSSASIRFLTSAFGRGCQVSVGKATSSA